MPSSTHSTILAINQGTRYISFAIFRQGQLFDWGIHLLSTQSGYDKSATVKRLISRYFLDFQPVMVVMKTLHPARTSFALTRQSQQIEMLAKKEGIPVYRYTIQEMETFFIPDRRINRRHLYDMICQQHPVLTHTWQKEQTASNPYYARVLEAVVLGTIACAKLDRSMSSDIQDVTSSSDSQIHDQPIDRFQQTSQ